MLSCMIASVWVDRGPAMLRHCAPSRGRHGLTPTQLALGFCYGSWRVASTILGVTTVSQLDECVDAWGTELSADILAELDAIRWELRDPAI